VRGRYLSGTAGRKSPSALLHIGTGHHSLEAGVDEVGRVDHHYTGKAAVKVA
jgi:hypothetical protein